MLVNLMCTLLLRHVCKYGNPFSGYPDYVWIDDIDIYEVNPCSYFTLSYSSDSSTTLDRVMENATVSATNDSPIF